MDVPLGDKHTITYLSMSKEDACVLGSHWNGAYCMIVLMTIVGDESVLHVCATDGTPNLLSCTHGTRPCNPSQMTSFLRNAPGPCIVCS